MTNNRISIKPSFIAGTFGIIAAMLIMINIITQILSFKTGHHSMHGLIPFFFVDREFNMPAYFSSFMLLFICFILFIITILKKKEADKDMVKWAFLSLGFLYMSMDEVCRIHERLIEPIRDLFGGGQLGIFYFAWVIPGIIVVMFLGLYFLRFLLRLPKKTRIAFLIAAFLYLGGALGVELLAGHHGELYGFDFTYSMIVTVEESLEMAGCIYFIWALLSYIGDVYPGVHFEWEKSQDRKTDKNS